jgi:ABC-type iron transport system FetAB permease component
MAVMSPTVANLQTTALYTMPLLLCGFLIAGVSPLNAFVVMMMLVIGCVAASVVALVATLWLADGKLFDSFGKLRWKG